MHAQMPTIPDTIFLKAERTRKPPYLFLQLCLKYKYVAEGFMR